MQPLEHQNDTASQVLLYRNFLWGRIAPLVKKERESPGRVAEDIERDLVYSRRSKVSFFFILFLLESDCLSACQESIRFHP